MQNLFRPKPVVPPKRIEVQAQVQVNAPTPAPTHPAATGPIGFTLPAPSTVNLPSITLPNYTPDPPFVKNANVSELENQKSFIEYNLQGIAKQSVWASTQVNTCTQYADAYTSDIASFKSSMGIQSQQIATLQTDIHNANMQKNAIARSAAYSGLTQQINQLTQQQQSTNDAILQTQAQIATIQNNQIPFTFPPMGDYFQQQDQLNSLQIQLSISQSTYSQLTGQIDGLISENSEIIATQNAEAQPQLNALNTSIANYTSQMQNASADLQTNTQKMNTSQQNLNKASEYLHIFNERITGLQSVTKVLQTELAEVVAKIKTQIKSAISSIQTTKQQIVDLSETASKAANSANTSYLSIANVLVENNASTQVTAKQVQDAYANAYKQSQLIQTALTFANEQVANANTLGQQGELSKVEAIQTVLQKTVQQCSGYANDATAASTQAAQSATQVGKQLAAQSAAALAQAEQEGVAKEQAIEEAKIAKAKAQSTAEQDQLEQTITQLRQELQQVNGKKTAAKQKQVHSLLLVAK